MDVIRSCPTAACYTFRYAQAPIFREYDIRGSPKPSCRMPEFRILGRLSERIFSVITEQTSTSAGTAA